MLACQVHLDGGSDTEFPPQALALGFIHTRVQSGFETVYTAFAEDPQSDAPQTPPRARTQHSPQIGQTSANLFNFGNSSHFRDARIVFLARPQPCSRSPSSLAPLPHVRPTPVRPTSVRNPGIASPTNRAGVQSTSPLPEQHSRHAKQHAMLMALATASCSKTGARLHNAARLSDRRALRALPRTRACMPTTTQTAVGSAPRTTNVSLGHGQRKTSNTPITIAT